MIISILNKYINAYFTDNKLFIFLSCTKQEIIKKMRPALKRVLFNTNLLFILFFSSLVFFWSFS